MAGKYRLTTLGCKVNQYESAQVRQLLESAGYLPARPGEHADIAIVNTCAVTCSATAKSRQALRRLARRCDQTVAMGCFAQADPRAVSRIGGVTEVVGHDADVLARIHRLIADEGRGSPRVGADDRDDSAPVGDRSPDLVQVGWRLAGGACSPGGELPSRPLNTNYYSIGRPGPKVNRSAPAPAGRSRDDREEPGTAVWDNAGGPQRERAGGLEEGPHTCARGSDVTSADGDADGCIPGGSGRSGLARLMAAPGDTLTTSLRAFGGRTRAFLKIQDGCDASCTYCIIPRLRSTLRYKPIPVAVDEARALVRAGHKEIVLTGIFLGAYHRSTAIRRRFGDDGSPLADLVDALAGIEGLARLRLSSLEPGDMDDALLGVIARHSNCVPHFHLPLQSGSGHVLRRMNRQYSIDAYLAMIDRVRAVLDRPAITTDIIVGFAGESDGMFKETLDVARSVGFCKIHAFPFSPRPGTAAWRWTDQFVHPQTVKDRMATLATLDRQEATAYAGQFIGTRQRVLVEGASADHTRCNSGHRPPNRRQRAPDERRAVSPSTVKKPAHGRTDRYFPVVFESDTVQPGDLVEVRIDRVTPTRVHGVLAG